MIGYIYGGPYGATAGFTIGSSGSYYLMTGDENLRGLHEAGNYQDTDIIYFGEWEHQENHRPRIGDGNNNNLKYVYANDNGDLLDIKDMYASNNSAFASALSLCVVDMSIPEPSDVVPLKWMLWGGALVGAAAWDILNVDQQCRCS